MDVSNQRRYGGILLEEGLMKSSIDCGLVWFNGRVAAARKGNGK